MCIRDRRYSYPIARWHSSGLGRRGSPTFDFNRRREATPASRARLFEARRDGLEPHLRRIGFLWLVLLRSGGDPVGLAAFLDVGRRIRLCRIERGGLVQPLFFRRHSRIEEIVGLADEPRLRRTARRQDVRRQAAEIVLDGRNAGQPRPRRQGERAERAAVDACGFDGQAQVSVVGLDDLDAADLRGEKRRKGGRKLALSLIPI